ncbi:MAG: zinc ribbon domain-containing protein [Legionellales bacterium]|nr:zinc ribbon domain-containing protein [Legionellales bacterium]
MPIYEYQCPVCQYQFEEMQKISDPPLSHCPQCQHEGVTKLVSACGFELKGSGWYVTDFKDKSSAKTKTTEATDTAPSSTTSDNQTKQNSADTGTSSSTDSSS